MWTFPKLLQDLPGAIRKLGRFEYGLILCGQQCIAACLWKKDLHHYRRIRRSIKRLRRSLEWILFGFLVVLHEQLHSTDNIDEESDRNCKAHSQDDHSDFYVSRHISWGPVPRPKIVGRHPRSC